MKKALSLMLTLALSSGGCFLTLPAAGQPFASGTMGSDEYRIPALITLNDGRVMAAADMRYTHGQDSPENIDTLVAYKNSDGWDYQVLNHFDDCADGTSSLDSASFIDSAVVQSEATGRIFVVTTFYPSGCGTPNAKRGSGFITDKNGVRHLALTASGNDKMPGKYECYVGEFDGDFANVVGTDKNYTVDKEYNLYLDGKPIYTKQINSDKQVQQNVFFSSADYHVFPTSYLAMRYSDDNGASWSSLNIVSGSIKQDSEGFLGVCPGRGALTAVNGKERILFPVYDNSTACERMSVMYSDDNGETWQRGERARHMPGVGKTSESQIITCPDGSLKMFARNTSRFVACAKSYDGGVTWGRFTLDRGLNCTKNCMVSFINYKAAKIDGKDVVIGSYGTGGAQRRDGIIRVGLMSEGGEIEWISTYRLNEGFFAYSCLTELPDGRIACLYEYDPSQMVYREFELNADGTLTACDGGELQYDGVKRLSLINLSSFGSFFFRELLFADGSRREHKT